MIMITIMIMITLMTGKFLQRIPVCKRYKVFIGIECDSLSAFLCLPCKPGVPYLRHATSFYFTDGTLWIWTIIAKPTEAPLDLVFFSGAVVQQSNGGFDNHTYCL